MSKLIDLTGRKFGKLTVVERAPNYKTKTNKNTSITQWKCICDCGGEKIAAGTSLRRGITWHCGCEKRKMPIKHGYSHTRLHDKWIGIRQRCYNKNDAEYKNYGGRGITVCEEWSGTHGAENFIKWALENGWDDSKDTADMTIDRIDFNGNYAPSNCRLVGKEIQANNKRNCIYIEYNGETMTLAQLCKKYNLNYDRVHDRYTKKGYSLEEAMFTPKNGLYKRHSS